MKFLTPLILEKRRDVEREWINYQDFIIRFVHEGVVYGETIPRGFITDLASIPRIAQLLPGFGVNEASADSAVPHDFHYCNQGRLTVTKPDGKVVRIELTRKQCDQLLYDGIRAIDEERIKTLPRITRLIARALSRTKASMFYTAVRIGGWIYWNRRSNGLIHDYDFVPHDFDWSKP